MDATKRIAVYLRVSTLDQSTDLQKREILEYVSARGWNTFKVYEDAGKTNRTSLYLGNRYKLPTAQSTLGCTYKGDAIPHLCTAHKVLSRVGLLTNGESF